MRVLFFTDGVLSPGSRFRCLQFFAHLEANGIRCEARFAYDERYNSVFAQPWAPLYKLGRRMRRVGHLLFDTDADIIFVHKTALALSGIPEWLRGLGTTPMVFDFDDAIYLGPGGVESSARRRTFEQVAASADALIAGNAHLARVAGHPDKTIVIPSVVDTEAYTPLASSTASGLVIGWMGTASNFPYLRRVLPSVLNAVARIPGARLRVVSNGTLPEYESEPLLEQWQWRAERELMALRSFDVGLMPLDDSELTRGKCGFK
ncbi:MAG: hypothetical protein JNG84_06385, partial [Archangium sp.]|nr:hypothetical protein [Archangium sp.]